MIGLSYKSPYQPEKEFNPEVETYLAKSYWSEKIEILRSWVKFIFKGLDPKFNHPRTQEASLLSANDVYKYSPPNTIEYKSLHELSDR